MYTDIFLCFWWNIHRRETNRGMQRWYKWCKLEWVNGLGLWQILKCLFHFRLYWSQIHPILVQLFGFKIHDDHAADANLLKAEWIQWDIQFGPLHIHQQLTFKHSLSTSSEQLLFFILFTSKGHFCQSQLKKTCSSFHSQRSLLLSYIEESHSQMI